MEGTWKPAHCSSLAEEGSVPDQLYKDHHLYEWDPELHVFIAHN